MLYAYIYIGIPMGKKNVMIYVEEELVEEAKELGFNISELCENCLKEAIRRMTQPKTSENCSHRASYCQSNNQLVDGAGFEPAASTMPTWRSFHADLPAQWYSN
jgi:post-segregation antitoxin (ccd killing protein)